MMILVIASLTPTATANYLIGALREAGHELFVCSDADSPLAQLRVRGLVHVEGICKRYGLSPELVLFVEGGPMQIFPVGLEHLTCLTTWYGIDTHMDYGKHLRIGRLFDVTFIAQKEFVERLHQDGLRQVHWLPLAFAPELMPEAVPCKNLDIAHVGSNRISANPIRHALLDALRHQFPSHYFGPATPKEMYRIYASARLVFNHSVNNDVNMRFFEAAGAGAVIVSDQIIDNGVETLFKENVHYAVYRDEDSLPSVVHALLADPQRCEAMGRAARQRVLEQHTYLHRANALMKEISISAKLVQQRPEDYFAAFLALNILGAAIDAAAQAMLGTSRGTYRKIAGGAAAVVLRGLGYTLGVIERIRNRWR